MKKIATALVFTGIFLAGSAAHAAKDAADFPKYSGSVRAFTTSSTYNNNAGGWNDYDPWWGYGMDASVNSKLSNGTDIQAEVRNWHSNSRVVSDSSYDVYSTLAVAHWSKRDSDILYGIFGGWLGNSSYYDSGPNHNILLGLEGQGYLSDDFTVYAQLGAVKNLKETYKPRPELLDFTQVTGRYFFGDNTKLEGSGSYFYSNRIGDSNGEDASMVAYNLEIEHRFEDAPFSLFAGFGGYKDSASIDTDGQTWTFGAKYSFGSSSLRDEDRQGATLKAIDFSPVSWLKLDNW